MGIGWLFLLLAVLWALQLGLAYQQAQAFMARAKALRRLGRTEEAARVLQAVGPSMDVIENILHSARPGGRSAAPVVSCGPYNVRPPRPSAG